MRLINTSTLELRWLTEDEPTPPYAALSHCWGIDEVEYDDLHSNTRDWTQKYGFQKLWGACREAFGSHKLDWLWADTVCINRSSSAELSESINSMYRWYRNCTICLAYLDDIYTASGPPEDLLVSSRWMRRSWTLVELIAPRKLEFYTSKWLLVGSKDSLIPTLTRITQVDQTVLEDAENLGDLSVGKRMSWAAHRSALRIEDIAYSLIGIFGVNMTIIYGEGSRAFIRLQEELLKAFNDESLFAWKATDDQEYRGLFARSPLEFGHLNSPEFATTPWRLPTALRMALTSPTLVCSPAPNKHEGEILMPLAENPGKGFMGIKFRMWRGELVRCDPKQYFYVSINVPSSTREVPVARDVDTRSSKLISQSMTNEPQPQIVQISNSHHGNSFSNENGPFSFQPPGTGYCAPHRGEETESERTGHVLSAAAQSSTGMSLLRGPSLRRTVGTEETSVATPKDDNTSVPSEADDDDDDDEESEESSDYESYLFLSPALEGHPMELDPPFAVLTDALATTALDRFTAWVTGRTASCKRTQTIEGPTVRKRIKAEDFLEHIPVESRELPGDEDTIMVDAPGSRSLACPFYLHDKERHSRCLTRVDLGTIRDLKRHLWTAHRQPYYCPTCGITFARASTRDEHIKARACSPQQWKGTPQGLSEGQLQLLAKRCRSSTSEVDQWFKIWHLIFPETDTPSSSPPRVPRTPYLAGKFEFAVCVARGYWAREGKQVIADFLEERSLRDYEVPDEERNLSALYQIVLDNVIDRLLQQLRDEEDCNVEPRRITLGRMLSSFRKFCSKMM